MRKHATTIGLAVISLASIAQNSIRLFTAPEYKSILPGLSYIPSKSFTSLAYTGSDSVSFYKPRISSVKGFYISKTEVTNKEYREFVHYVRDSMAHVLLKHFEGNGFINWSLKIDWKNPALEPMMIKEDERLYGKREIDTDMLIYKPESGAGGELVRVYPDTMTWIKDFTYSYNEPLVKKYFSDTAYNNYPVTGVNLKQAMAFCQWKTVQVNQSIKINGNSNTQVEVRLPTNAEWESAAFEEKDTSIFTPYNNNYRYNFGKITDANEVTIKSYGDDGYFYTGPVKSFPQGAYGLYNMKGNISEWTATTMEEVMSTEMKVLKAQNNFVVKGGGWNNTPFYLQAGVCQFFPAEATHTYIGFRYVVSIKSQ